MIEAHYIFESLLFSQNLTQGLLLSEEALYKGVQLTTMLSPFLAAAGYGTILMLSKHQISEDGLNKIQSQNRGGFVYQIRPQLHNMSGENNLDFSKNIYNSLITYD